MKRLQIVVGIAVVCACGFIVTKPAPERLRFQVTAIRYGSYENSTQIGRITKTWVDGGAYIEKTYMDGSVEYDFVRNPFEYEKYIVGHWYIKDSHTAGLVGFWVMAFIVVTMFIAPFLI